MKDPVGVGTIAGLVGVLAINLVEYVLLNLNISETPLWHAGGIVFLTEAALQTPLGIAIGIFSHVFIAIVLGVLIAYYISFTGKELAIMKGIGVSLIAGFIVLTIIFPLRGLAADIQQSPGDTFAALIDHTVFGALAGYVIIRLQSKSAETEDIVPTNIRYIKISSPQLREKKKVFFRKPKRIQ